MKRFGIIAALCLSLFGFVGKASAQSDGMPNLKGKLVYGGTFGGGLSGNFLNLSLSPQVGYRIFHPWEIGVRGTYDLKARFDALNGNVFRHYLGVGPYTSVEVFRGLFLYAEDEVLYGFSSGNHETWAGRWYNSVFVGGGFRQYTYNGSYVYIMALYNLSWGNLSNNVWETPYASPLSIRVGYCF